MDIGVLGIFQNWLEQDDDTAIFGERERQAEPGRATADDHDVVSAGVVHG